MFSLKDKLPIDPGSYVVYKFVCGNWKADYIGHTKWHLSIRIKEYLEIDGSLDIYKYLKWVTKGQDFNQYWSLFCNR